MEQKGGNPKTPNCFELELVVSLLYNVVSLSSHWGETRSFKCGPMWRSHLSSSVRIAKAGTFPWETVWTLDL